MELLETILSLGTMFTLAQLSCSVCVLTPFCLIASDFLSSRANVGPVSSSAPWRRFSFSGSTEHTQVDAKTIPVLLACELSDVNNNR